MLSNNLPSSKIKRLAYPNGSESEKSVAPTPSSNDTKLSLLQRTLSNSLLDLNGVDFSNQLNAAKINSGLQRCGSDCSMYQNVIVRDFYFLILELDIYFWLFFLFFQADKSVKTTQTISNRMKLKLKFHFENLMKN